MNKIVLSFKAKQDLISIWTYIANDAEAAAHKMVDQIDAVFESISRFPMSAVAVPHIKQGVRCVSAGQYRIYFRVVDQSIEVLRILHGRRKQNLK